MKRWMPDALHAVASVLSRSIFCMCAFDDDLQTTDEFMDHG